MVTTYPKMRMPTVWDSGSDRLCQLKIRPRPSVGYASARYELCTVLFTPVPTDAARYKNANAHTLGEIAISAPNPAKMSSATPATSLRLPRSAHTARGTAHKSCDTCAMKATAPSDALDMWNDVWRLCPISVIPLPKVPGTSAAAVIRTSGAYPDDLRMPTSGGGLPSPVPGMTATSATTSGSLTCVTASRKRSSGTAKSNSGSLGTEAGL